MFLNELLQNHSLFSKQGISCRAHYTKTLRAVIHETSSFNHIRSNSFPNLSSEPISLFLQHNIQRNIRGKPRQCVSLQWWVFCSKQCDLCLTVSCLSLPCDILSPLLPFLGSPLCKIKSSLHFCRNTCQTAPGTHSSHTSATSFERETVSILT